MAFTLQNWCRASTSANEPLVTLADATISGCFREYNYHTADTQLVVAAASYFDTVNYDLTTGDYVNVYSSTDLGLQTYRITNTAGVITGTELSASRYAQVAVTAAEFNGMYVASKLLVAAKGANTLIVLDSCQLVETYVAPQYQAGGVVHLQYAATANGAGLIASTTQAAADFFDAADTANGFNQGIVKQPFATAVNQGLYLANITQAFTTGASTFVAHVWYKVIATA